MRVIDLDPSPTFEGGGDWLLHDDTHRVPWVAVLVTLVM